MPMTVIPFALKQSDANHDNQEDQRASREHWALLISEKQSHSAAVLKPLHECLGLLHVAFKNSRTYHGCVCSASGSEGP
jgi:hypothetical protein